MGCCRGKNILLLVLSLCCVQALSAQECNYIEYHEFIKIAKENVYQKKYKKARESFQRAFAITDFPLGRDLDLALYTANKVKDNKWAPVIAEKLAKGGVPLRYFVRFKHRKWFKGFKFQFEGFSKFFEKNFNHQLRNEYMALLAKDVLFNKKYHKWRTREIYPSLEELIDGASSVLLDYKKIICDYGFPTEKKMGYNYIKKQNAVEEYNTLVLIVHLYQTGTPLLKETITSVVCEGGIRPDFAITLKKIQGYGNGAGVEQEMKARYEVFRKTGK